LLTSLEISLEIAYVPVLKYKNKGEIMGRAIDMENDIYKLTARVETLENQIRGMVSKLDEVEEKSSKTKHIDLVEDVKVEEKLGSVITGDYENENKKEKTDNEGNGKSSKQSNSKPKQPGSKSK
jgi:hypothetical protein|tara:strand:+ start:602 stop:973 length:372 start_codon:yes stop_codon:yes gene_type:complete